MRVFTFWEPASKIPAYVRLCMKTWARYLPNAEIVVLDYSNINKWIDLEEYGPKLKCGKFSLPQIADAIRAKVLANWGGVWLDADTILLDERASNYFQGKSEVGFFGGTVGRGVHIGVIRAEKNSELMRLWERECQRKIKNIDNVEKDKNFWAYLGNSIIGDYVKQNKEKVEVIDCIKENVTPEKQLPYYNQRPVDAYVDFYFRNSFDISTLHSSLIMLHNSWTPGFIKQMNEEEFLRLDCTLAAIISKSLGLKNIRTYKFQDVEIGNLRKEVKELKEAFGRLEQQQKNLCTRSNELSFLLKKKDEILIKYWCYRIICLVPGLSNKFDKRYRFWKAQWQSIVNFKEK